MMKIIKLIVVGIFIFVLCCCKSERDKKLDILLNSAGKEWELEKMKGKSITLAKERDFLIFHKDFTYEIYRKENGRRIYSSSDVILEQEWFIDSSGQLHLADFRHLKLLKLDNKHLVYQFGKTKFEFVCKECE